MQPPDGRGDQHCLERLDEVARQHQQGAKLREPDDAIGPLLFAVGVDLVALQGHSAIQADTDLQARLAATGDGVARMQQKVRSIPGRLRSGTGMDVGLRHSFERLVAFRSLLHPVVSFDLEIAEEHLESEVAAQVHRVVQGSLSNALRHGHFTCIVLRVLQDTDGSLLAEVCDDGGGLRPVGLRRGLGLTGMRERMQEPGGTLEVSAAGLDGRGARVRALLPGSLHDMPI